MTAAACARGSKSAAPAERLLQIPLDDVGRTFGGARGILAELLTRMPLTQQVPQAVELHVHVVQATLVVGAESRTFVEKRMLLGNECFDMLMKLLIGHVGSLPAKGGAPPVLSREMFRPGACRALPDTDDGPFDSQTSAGSRRTARSAVFYARAPTLRPAGAINATPRSGRAGPARKSQGRTNSAAVAHSDIARV
jgi:hypothetical protein